MKKTNFPKVSDTSKKVKVLKVEKRASQVTGGGAGPIPESFGGKIPGMNWYG